MPGDPADGGPRKRQWRDYETELGNPPVKEFLMSLTSEDRAAIVAEMAIVKRQGMRAARHLRGEIYEVRIKCTDVIYRILFAREGKYKQVLLVVRQLSFDALTASGRGFAQRVKKGLTDH